MSQKQYSQRPSRHHASEVDANGMMLKEDDTTSPVGYRWLHANCTPKSFSAKGLTFLVSRRAGNEAVSWFSDSIFK
jgi:hypothetical protein